MESDVLQTEHDRYIIVRHIAEGGMGAIFLGKKVGVGGFEREVVLKQLLPEFTSEPQFIELFLREARLSASLDHANIVRTIDLVSAGDNYFIVMEYVDGADLRALLKRSKHRGRSINSAAAIFIAREVLTALAYAHGKRDAKGRPLGLIHRDVSPSNIMISSAGEVKLTDFGIAKAATHKTVYYQVKGKVGYMSPEQAKTPANVDLRSDLFSAAVIIYEMLAGERLFVGDLMTTPTQIYSQPIRQLESIEGVPAGIDALLRKGLALEPDDRFQNAGDFLEALVDIAFRHQILFSAPELALHLQETCGADASQWAGLASSDVDSERPATQAISDVEEFSGVELTSMLHSWQRGSEASSRANGQGPLEYAATEAAMALPSSIDEAQQAAVAPLVDDDPTRDLRKPLSDTTPEGLPQPPDSADSSQSFADDATTVYDRKVPAKGASLGDTLPEANPVDAIATAPRPSSEVLEEWSDGLEPSGTSHTAQVRLRFWHSAIGRRKTLLLVGLLLAVALCLFAVLRYSRSGLDGSESKAAIDETSADAQRADDAGADAEVGPHVTIQSRPTGAWVVIDGVRQCRTPCRVERLSSSRTYSLSLKLDGYQTWSKLLDLRRGPRPHIRAELIPR